MNKGVDTISKIIIKRCLFIFLALIVTSCDKPDKPQYQKTSFSRKGMVVSAHHLATKTGNDILKKGGTANDAAIATYFALAVVYPRAGNLGGGGFAITRNPDGEVRSLDFRETAPGAANKEMYLDSNKQVIEGLSLEGPLSIGVPGSVAGMYEFYRTTETKLTWPELLYPAVELAKNGFTLSAYEANRLNDYQTSFITQNGRNIPFVKEGIWREGDILIQPNLARTLEQIAIDTTYSFYNGEIAESIVSRVDSSEGILTLQDFQKYRPKWRQPVSIPYKQYVVHSMGPPSSGGIVLGQILKMIEPYSLDNSGLLTVYNIHLISEASKRAFYDRSRLLGDSDFVDINVSTLLSVKYLNQKMKDYQADIATPSQVIATEYIPKPLETYETTHFSIVDGSGYAVSITTTLNGNYGSKVFVHDRGFFLNNQMDDFSLKDNHPNQFGLIGNKANVIQPNKRMLSSMTPTIIDKNGELYLVIGSPGGPTIISSVLDVFLSVAEMKSTLTEAISSGRFHHQCFPDEILIEKRATNDDLQKRLEQKGHTLRIIERMGSIAAILKHETGTLEGGADPRDESHAEGF